ncbi:hypothetical protein RvY_11211 [Ramazzottius varieornatus]|uniref:Uncharacterized protein n=1 Tax=Ramazzottius varieornatus TaxID=947166 RepID=A0A1D1VKT3_RAMVA|nr:hypothetical protein RvY_11211 [Ramazzottius varieornatus]
MNGKPVSVQNLMNSQQGGQQRGGGQQRCFPGGNRGGNSNGSSNVSTRECRAEVDLALRKPAKRLDVEAASSASEEFRKLEISKGYGISNQSFWLQETQSGNKSEGGNQQTEVKPGYNPDQLFDNTSCDAIEKEQQNKQREQ